jgi:uncharacterized protein YecE (DUF72 family)
LNLTQGKALIGTSGYSYPDWRGAFYPSDLRENDFLEYYKRYFPVLEINYTYYKMPSAAQMVRFAKISKGELGFAVKAHQGLTHGDDDPLKMKDFIGALKPISEIGALRCILLQFPFSFNESESNWTRIARLRDELGDIPGVLEFRHDSWISQETFLKMRRLDLAFCCVDQPALPGLIPSVIEATSSIGYIRFHGRNRARWWDHEEAWQRYDYQYSVQELSGWTRRINQLRSKTGSVFIFFNNHYQGQAVSSAQLLMALFIE